jgi:nicotinamide-nucleotide amidase
MKAIILNIGDEVVSGKVVNTNASFIANELEKIGIIVDRIVSIRDIPSDIENETKSFLDSEAKILITTGGLGPTHDDITKEVISSTLGLKLEFNSLASRNEYNYEDGAKTDCNAKQAYIPENSRVISNELGTADGIYIESNDRVIILLVGPPYENEPMLKKVLPELNRFGEKILLTDFTLMGQTEAYFENMLQPLLSYNVSIAPYASNGKVRFRIFTSSSFDEYYQVVEAFRKLFKDYIISEKDEDINEVLVNVLKANNLKISFGESMTGGYLSKLITDVSGASQVFQFSVVTYHNELKTNILGVNKDLIENHGVVSEEVTEAMAVGLEKLSNADINVTVSGDAGPAGDVGKVCYTIKFNDQIINKTKQFKGSRDMIRIRASRSIFYDVLGLIRKMEK